MHLCDDYDYMGTDQLDGWLTDLKKGTSKVVRGVTHAGLGLARSYVKGPDVNVMAPEAAAPQGMALGSMLPALAIGGVLLAVVMTRGKS